MHALYFFSVMLHILAAAAWIGGSLFLALVLVPAAKRAGSGSRGIELVHSAARRFSILGWISLAVLVTTGSINLWVTGVTLEHITSASFWSSPRGTTLSWKLILVGAIVALSAVHDFILGPIASRCFAAAPASRQAIRFRHACRWGGRITLVLGLLAVAFGVALVRGSPF